MNSLGMTEALLGEAYEAAEKLEPEVMIILFDCNLAAWARVGPSAFISAVKAYVMLIRLLAVAKPYQEIGWLAYREAGQTLWLQQVTSLPSGGASKSYEEEDLDSAGAALERLRSLPQQIARLVQFARSIPETVASAGSPDPSGSQARSLPSSSGHSNEVAFLENASTAYPVGEKNVPTKQLMTVYPSSVSVALLQALCRLHALGWLSDPLQTSQGSLSDLAQAPHEQEKVEPAARARLVLFSAPGPFDAAEFIPLWNAAFCAQQSQLVIDAVRIEAAGSTCSKPEALAALQQLTYATKGIYVECRCACERLFLHLMTHIVPSPVERRYLTRKVTEAGSEALGGAQCGVIESVDLRPNCAQTGKLVQMGYVCSRCLSVYSVSLAECIVCGARWDGGPSYEANASLQSPS
jgi:hypothetical protein